VGCCSPGRRQSRSLRQQSHPTRVVAGVGILLAHIRAQREPVVPPAGTGTEYRRPEGSPDGSQQHKPARRQETPRIDGSNRSMERAADAIRGEIPSRLAGPGRRAGDAHTVAEGGVCWGVPRGAGGWPRAVGNGPAWRGERRRQDALREAAACAARGPRLPVGLDRQRALAVRVAAARPERAALAGALAHRRAALRARRRRRQLDGERRAAYCCTSWATQADCLAMKVSSVIWPASIMSSACSQTAVVPGSAMAAGTASIR
jgi:hypothetical protein